MKKSSKLVLAITILIIVLLAALITLIVLRGRNGNTSQQEEIKYPVGVYKVIEFGDKDGNYVEDYNYTEDDEGNKVNTIAAMLLNNQIAYFNINNDGSGTYIDSRGTKNVNFTNDYYTFNGEEKKYEYTYKDDKFWYADEEYPEVYCVFKKTSMDEIELIFSGKGGSMPIKEAKVGDFICLGQYEQDPSTQGKEPIYWRVLDKSDGKILVIAENLIETKAFNEDTNADNVNDVTWENSSLRKFLNEDFINNNFSEDEVKKIVTTSNPNSSSNQVLSNYWRFDKAPYSDMSSQNHADGNTTEDKVFLLSVDEVLKYFPNENETGDDKSEYPFNIIKTSDDRTAYVTKAATQGYFDYETGEGAWITRTLSDPNNRVVYITGKGQFFNFYTNAPMFIRPAMWISTN